MARPAMAMRKAEWERIKNQLAQGKAKETDNHKAYIDSLNKASEEMTKSWTNTPEKALKRQEEELKEKKKREEEDRYEFHRNLIEKKRLEREEVMAEYRDTFFKQKDEPRLLESALMCSEMLREQSNQRAFNEKLKQSEKKKSLDYAKQVSENVDKWNAKQSLKQKARLEKCQQEFLFVKAQADEMRRQRAKEKEEELLVEKQDNINAQKEIDSLINLTLEMRANEKNAIIKHLEEVRELDNKRREREIQDDKSENKLVEIYNNASEKMQQARKRREIEIAAEKNKIRDAVRKIIIVGDESRKKKEEESLNKAAAELKKREVELIKKEKAHREALKEEKNRFYEEWLESEKQRELEETNERTREIFNRETNNNYTAVFRNRDKQIVRKNAVENKMFILKQMKELAEERAMQKAEMTKFYQTDRQVEIDAADEKYLSYADSLVRECEATGRPTHPLLKVIKDYKSRYLHPNRFVPTHLKTHFPKTDQQNGSNQDHS